MAWRCFFLEGPDSTPGDFVSSAGLVSTVGIEQIDKGDTDYFELWVSLENGERFFLRQPVREKLDEYAAKIEVTSKVEIRSKPREGKRLIVSIVSGKTKPIPFTDFLSSELEKRKIILICSLSFFFLGVILLLLKTTEAKE